MEGGIQDVAKIPELRKRVIFTLAMLIVYRIGVFVPTPGIDAEKLRRIFEITKRRWILSQTSDDCES